MSDDEREEEQAGCVHCRRCNSGCGGNISGNTALMLAEAKKARWHINCLMKQFPILNMKLMASVSICHSGSVKSHVPPGDAYAQSSLQLQNRRFTYSELEAITSNFQRVLGRGGFGFVYEGFLEDGTQVAVKLRSDSSNQGVKEFLAEVGCSTCFQMEICISQCNLTSQESWSLLTGSDLSTDSPQESRVHDRLL